MSDNNETEQEVKNIEISKIEQNENSRTVYKVAELGELMQSMKQHGLQQAIGVSKLPNGKFDMVYGNRRLVAAKKLDWKHIPARIINVDDETHRDILGLTENLKRLNTSPAEDGRMFQVLKDRGLSVDEIAARVSVTVERVEAAIEIFNGIPKEYHKKISNPGPGFKKKPNQISGSAAKSILGMRRRYGLTRKQTGQLLDFALHPFDLILDVGDRVSQRHKHGYAPCQD